MPFFGHSVTGGWRWRRSVPSQSTVWEGESAAGFNLRYFPKVDSFNSLVTGKVRNLAILSRLGDL